MNHDLQNILAGKSRFRKVLAARDIREKLRMLDAMRERGLTLRAARLNGNQPQKLGRQGAD
jgi:hypothetical protein